MASVSERGDKLLAQVRINRGGVTVFSKSQLFEKDQRAAAESWGVAGSLQPTGLD